MRYMVEKNREAKLRRDIAAYAKEYTRKLYARELETPGGGDCWYCCMRDVKTGKPLGGADHIRDHVREHYYVPSLVVNAVEAYGSKAMKHDVAVCLKFPGSSPDMRLWGMQDQIQRSIVKWCKKEVGIA